MTAAGGVLSVVRFLVRIISSALYVAIIVPIGIVINIPPLLYWVILAAVHPKEYDVEKVAPFLSPKSKNAAQGSLLDTRPRIFFDGCAWCISFEMGVCQHLLQVPVLRMSILSF